MIITLILASCVALQPADITFDQAVQIANQFRMSATRGILEDNTLIQQLFDVEEDSKLAGEPDTYFVLNYPDTLMSIIKNSGRIQSYNCSIDIYLGSGYNRSYIYYPFRSNLSIELAYQKAVDYITQAGYAGNYEMRKVELFQDQSSPSPRHDFYQFDIARVIAPGVKELDHFRVEMEPTTGVLTFFLAAKDPPEPPANLTATITPDTARAAMASYIFSHFYQYPIAECQPVELVVWRPWVRNTSDNYLTDAQKLLGEQNKGILAYYAEFTFLTNQGRLFGVYIDPQTGTVQYAWDSGSGFGVTAGKPEPLGWDWGIGPISSMNGKKAIVAQNADIAECKPKLLPKTGVKLFIHRGRMNVPILFDAKSGLIWHETGGKRRYGKPNASLLKALVKVASQ